MTRALWRAFGIGLLVLPLIPLPTLTGAPDAGPRWLPYLGAWGVGLAAAAAIGLLLAWAARRQPPPARMRRLPPWPTALVAAAVVAILAAVVNAYAFHGNPHLVDEMAQLLHARAFAAGHLALPVPPLPESFLITHTWITQGGWTSQYPPGQTALLALGLLAGAPQLVNPLLGGVATLLLFVLARGLYGSRTAVTAIVLWMLSAWVVFMSASFMNHVGAMVFTLATWAAVIGPRRPGRWHFVLAGLMLGLLTITRPVDGAAAAIPLLVWGATRRHWRGMAWAAVGGLPIAIAWAWMNARMYGDPLTLGYSVLYGKQHGMGFHEDPWGRAFTPAVALSNLAVVVRRLHIYLYEWPIPSLLPLGIWALAARHTRRADRFMAIGLLAVPAFYFFYWHSRFFLGPRFYFVCAPLLVLGTARAWRWAWRHARGQARPGHRTDMALATVAVIVVLWGAAGVMPDRLRLYAEDLPTFKLHPERDLRAQGVSDAIVLVPESFGARTIVGLWGLGVKPGLVERAYRWMDTCHLYGELRAAREQHLPVDSVNARLEADIAARPEAAPFVNWPDKTLRLDPQRPPPDWCRDQLQRDLGGFTLYGPWAWRNPVNIDHGIVFMRDMGEATAHLLRRWPGRDVWGFAPPPGQPDTLPRLVHLGTVALPASGTGS